MCRPWRDTNSCCAAVLLLFTVLSPFLSHACSNGSSAVGDCLHTYLERDFSSIEAIIYAKKRGQKDGVLLLDGPELEDQCKRIEEVVECLEDLQPTCYYYNEFFPFRHLVTSLRKSIDWVCAPEHLRGRFRTLLNSFDCLESSRQKASSKGQPCFHPHIPVNIWQRIIRLQSGTEVCKSVAFFNLSDTFSVSGVHSMRLNSSYALLGHVSCIKGFIGDCAVDAQTVYQELNQLFLNSWCTSPLMLSSSQGEIRRTSTVLLSFIASGMVFFQLGLI